jgi:acetylornithine deacetylase/succinyl-diaminopimelate desuccinylase family protein
MIPFTVTALLQELIRIPSVNPDGSPGTDLTGEATIAAYLRDVLSEMGADVSLHEVLPGRPNVVARFPSSQPGKPRLLFAPHTDTVSITGMTIDPFAGELRDGKIWGRGASDTKGSIAAMLFALKESLPLIPDLPYEIWFAGLMGEETGLLGSKALAAEMPFDFVIAGEPTNLDVVHTTKGSVWATLKTTGQSVHASTPELGINAIYGMADILQCVRDEIAPALKHQSHPILGTPTISAGTISGGSKTNIVPNACEVSLDMRTIPGQDIQQVFNRLREIVPSVDIQCWESPPMMTPTDHPAIAAMEQCGATCVGAPWFCDAANFANHGVPAVAAGPGSIAQAHTKDEFISVSDLEEGVRFFSAFLRKL